MNTKIQTASIALKAIFLSLIVTLYLSPSKYHLADSLAASLIFLVFFEMRVQPSSILDALKPVTPLLILCVYAWAISFIEPGNKSNDYLKDLLVSFLPYLLFYFVFSTEEAKQKFIFLFAAFIIPGLIHIGYMYFDIFLAIHHGEVQFFYSSKQGLLEGIKDVPRVGRRYLSYALVHLIVGSLIITKTANNEYLKKIVGGLAVISLFSLALIDARGAYFSIAFGSVFFLIAIGQLNTKILKIFFAKKNIKKIAVFFILAIAVIALAISAGKSRWISMSYSFSIATHDVFQSDTPLQNRPYVDKNYWENPIENPKACYLSGQFRCRVDQSIYLRTAWVLEGIKGLFRHPLGIGYSKDYMGRLWDVEGDQTKYQRIDSSLTEYVIAFGFPSLLIFIYLGWRLAGSLSSIQFNTNFPPIVLTAIAGLIFICATRGIFDLLSEGLWRYLMALAGMYYGLLNSRTTKAAPPPVAYQVPI